MIRWTFEPGHTAAGFCLRHIKNVVLVYGGFVDGSGWEGVYRILRADGINVRRPR